MNCNTKGLISNIQRMSVHDGPGIRTTVFFKGCNMHCAWCHNPEAIHLEPEYVFNPRLCRHCGCCEQGCYSGARLLCGQEMTVDQIIKEVMMDQPYYSGTGGLTVSGGEPFLQPRFLVSLLKAAKDQGVHCGVETNGAVSFDIIETAIQFVNLWMIDLKIYDDNIHKKYTGISNEIIKSNLRELDRHDVKIILRTPVVPGVNDSAGELESIIAFASGLQHLEYYEVLPYHPLGLSKQVENTEFIREFPVPDKAAIKRIIAPIIDRYGIPFRFANVKMA